MIATPALPTFSLATPVLTFLSPTEHSTCVRTREVDLTSAGMSKHPGRASQGVGNHSRASTATSVSDLGRSQAPLPAQSDTRRRSTSSHGTIGAMDMQNSQASVTSADAEREGGGGGGGASQSHSRRTRPPPIQRLDYGTRALEETR